MFDIGWSELVLVAAVTLVVVGPKEIPRVLRTLRGVLAKVRGLSNEFHRTMEEAAREADLQDLKKDLMREGEQYAGVKDELFEHILEQDSVEQVRQEIEEFARQPPATEAQKPTTAATKLARTAGAQSPESGTSP